MQDFPQINSRKDFTKIINYMGYESGAEIGVCWGDNASWILENSKLKVLYGIENWSIKASIRCKELTEEKMSKYGDRFIWVIGDSVVKADNFLDGSLDFVYIDGNHRYSAIKRDLYKWYPKVRDGGFFGGHDYVIAKGCGVIKAVDDFFKSLRKNFYLTKEDPSESNISFWLIK